MMGLFFPGRERKHLKNKFKAEERANPDRVADALRAHVLVGPQAAGPLLQAAEVWRVSGHLQFFSYAPPDRMPIFRLVYPILLNGFDILSL